MRSGELGFSRQDRDTNIRRISFIAHLLARNGITVIVAAIAPYRAARAEARALLEPFVEVYVRCSLEELVRRDTKGLYACALRGEIANFTGVSDPYEEPLSPEIVVDTEVESVEHSTRRILARLEHQVARRVAEGGPAGGGILRV